MDDVPEHARDLFAARPLALAQQRQDRLAGVGLEDVDRLEAVAARVRVEQRELLAAVDEIVGVVDVEHDARRRRRVAVEVEIDQRDADLVERLGVGGVLQPRERRLAHQVDAGLGRAVAGDLECRVGLERIDVVAILVAGRDHHRARQHHVGERVRDQQRVAPVRDVARDPIRDARACRAISRSTIRPPFDVRLPASR